MINNNEKRNEVLQEKLQKIKDQEGIIGYIQKGSKSASIDLKDPKKIIEYAILSSTTFDVGKEMSEELQMGELEKIMVESDNSKFLLTPIDDQNLTIFMEKNVNHNKIYKELK